jgi:hypothetical protein
MDGALVGVVSHNLINFPFKPQKNLLFMEDFNFIIIPLSIFVKLKIL